MRSMLKEGHGAGAGRFYIEQDPVDEKPEGVPAPAGPERPTDRGPRGTFAPGNTIARKGGAAKRGQTRLAARLSLRTLPDNVDFATYKASAVTFRKATCTDLARTVGGGVCGVAPSSFVASAALQLAWSRYFSDLAASTGDVEHVTTASRLADASRQNLLAAHELCAREAKARVEDPGAEMRRMQAAFQAQLAKGTP